MALEKNTLRVHGPLHCPVSCSVCDGDHHWLESVIERDDSRFAVAVFEHKDEDGAAPILECKHCSAWADCPAWWGDDDENEDGIGVDFEAVDVREEARRGE